MFSTIETLSDEVLMMIFQYLRDIPSIFRSFLGLNERLNRILLDKRLHLLTNYLLIKVRDDYYNSEVFEHVTSQLLSSEIPLNDESLSSLLQTIVRFDLRQKYLRFGREFQLSRESVQSIREQQSDNVNLHNDEQLQTLFDSLNRSQLTMECLEEIQSLVLRKGARYIGLDYELVGFNFTKAVNQLLLDRIEVEKSISIHLIIPLFRTVLISNPSLINNRDYVGNGGCVLQYFLAFFLYRLHHFYHCRTSSSSLNLKYYRATTDLYLFVLQCQRQTLDEVGRSSMDILRMIWERNVNPFIQSIQWELMEIVLEECNGLENEFQNILPNLITKQRLDVILYIHGQIDLKSIFPDLDYIRHWMNIMTRSREGRRYFEMIVVQFLSEFLRLDEDWIFILLAKKERKLLEKIIRLSPGLVHQLDKEGNDPLLYITLKVKGCRHRIIDFLILMGADISRKNIHGQSFIDSLHFRKNRHLFVIKAPYHC